MSGVFEIREFTDDSTKSGEVVDILGEYNQLCASLQSQANNDSDNEIDGKGKSKTSTEADTSKRKIIDTLCERLNPEILTQKPDGNVSICINYQSTQ